MGKGELFRAIIGNLTDFHDMAVSMGQATGDRIILERIKHRVRKYNESDEEAIRKIEVAHTIEHPIYTVIGYLELGAIGVLGLNAYVLGIPWLSDQFMPHR